MANRVILTITESLLSTEDIWLQIIKDGNLSQQFKMVETPSTIYEFAYVLVSGTQFVDTEATLSNLVTVINALTASDYFAKKETADSISVINGNKEGVGLMDLVRSTDLVAKSTVTSELLVSPFKILFDSFQTAQSESVCGYVRANFNAKNAEYPITLQFPGINTKIANIAGELWLDILRQTSNRTLTATDNTGAVSTIEVSNVRTASISNINISTSLTTYSINIEVSYSGSGVIPLLNYSIDGINYQLNNSFSDILPGNYTAYILDEYGCQRTKVFTVSEVPRLSEPYFDFPRTNPVRFIEDKVNEFSTINNTLFSDLNFKNIDKKFYRQPFRVSDSIRLQLHSTYRDITIDVVDCDNNITDTFTPTKKIKNTGLQDKRDAFLTTGSQGNAAIAFLQGYIYDPDSNEVINTYFEPVGRLPSFIEKGVAIELFNTQELDGVYTILGIEYSSNLGAWIAVLNTSWSGAAETCIALSLYNAEKFDIYETAFNISQPGQYHLVMNVSDDDLQFEDQTWKSEPLFITEKTKGLIAIDYSATENQSGIDYRTGIVFRLRIPAQFFRYRSGGDDVSFTDDNGNTRIKKSVNVREIELKTHILPMWLVEKVVIAATHPDTWINGERVRRKEDKPDVSDLIDDHNPFFEVTAIFEEDKRLIITDQTGLISERVEVLGATPTTIIGV